MLSVEAATGEGAAFGPTELGLDGEFTGALTLASGAAALLRVQVTDDVGDSTVVQMPLVLDEAAPALTVTAPVDGSVHGGAVLTVTGEASDDHAVERVEVQVGAAGWIIANGTDPFDADVTLQPGPNTLHVRAVDVAGRTTSTSLALYRARAVALQMREVSPDGDPITLTVDKPAIEALISEAKAKDITLLLLDVRGLLVEAIKAVFDPVTYGVDTSTWGAAELNLQRVMTMTPDVADVSGTSMEPLLQLAGNLGVPVPTLLAQIPGIGVSDTFLTIEQVADAVYRNVLATHPNVVVDPVDGVAKVPVTMYDALHDLEPLAETLGPTGAHPGVLYAATEASVLLPNFALTVTGTSNLVQWEGIDLSSGKSWLFAKAPGVEVVVLDFLDPETFSLSGLADEPEVDLNVLIVEHPTFISGGTQKGGNLEDGFAKGNGPVWSVNPWTSEYMVTDAIFHATRDLYAGSGYQKSWSHDVGSIPNAATIHWDHGWVTVNTVAGIGSPPKPAYWWDVVLELTQVRMHDGLAEGEADLHLPLPGVRVPLTAEQLVDSMRPVLESQKAELSEAMVGDHSSYESPCDVFLVTGEDGQPYLYYVRDEDIPGSTALHAFAGFYEDSGLTTKRSTTASLGSGDTLHEKIHVDGDGETVYAAETNGSVWRLEVGPLVGGEVQVVLSPVFWESQ